MHFCKHAIGCIPAEEAHQADHGSACPLQILSGEVGIELGEEVDIPGWEKAVAPAVARKRVDASFGEDWTEKNLLPCIQRVLPLLHHPTRSSIFPTGGQEEGLPSSINPSFFYYCPQSLSNIGATGGTRFRSGVGFRVLRWLGCQVPVAVPINNTPIRLQSTEPPLPFKEAPPSKEKLALSVEYDSKPSNGG